MPDLTKPRPLLVIEAYGQNMAARRGQQEDIVRVYGRFQSISLLKYAVRVEATEVLMFAHELGLLNECSLARANNAICL